MAQGINIFTKDFGLGVAPPDTGNRIFIVGGTSGPFTGGVAEPITSRVPGDFRTGAGVNKATEAAALAVQTTGAAVTLFGFDAATTAATANVFQSRAAGAVMGTQLTVSFSADPPDDLSICVQFLNTGTIGTTGLEYRITLDGGQNWSPTKSLGTATTISLAPYAQNLVLTASEVIPAQCSIVAVSYAKIGGANALAAITAAINSALPGDAIYLASNESDATVASACALVLAAETQNRNMDLITEVRDMDRLGSETYSTWGAAAVVSASHTVSRIWCPCPGHYPTPGAFSDSPASRRSLALHLALRYLLNAAHVDPARISTGRSSVLTALPTLPIPSAANRVMKSPALANDPEYLHDERARPIFDAVGISSASTLVDLTGFYFYNARLRSTPGSDFDLVQISRVVHKARKAVYRALTRYLHEEITIDGETGFITEQDAAAKDAEVQQQVVDSIISVGNASSVLFQFSRTDNVLSTKTINSDLNIVPRGYLKTINSTVQLVNPAIIVA
jgi:Protein of unknown function (DUF2586)